MKRAATLMTAMLLSAARPAAAVDGVAKFRVVGQALDSSGTLSVNIAYEYGGEGNMGGNNIRFTGKGVRFFVHETVPSYGSASTGKPLGTVDMKEGQHFATLTFKPAELGVASAQKLQLAARWSNSHEWGTATREPETTAVTIPSAPAQNSRLRHGWRGPGRWRPLTPTARRGRARWWPRRNSGLRWGGYRAPRR